MPEIDWPAILGLVPGERIIRSWGGDYETKTKAVFTGSYKGAYTADVKDRKHGTLVLTNQRLIWAERHGSFHSSYQPDFDLPLDSIRGISQGGSVRKFVTVGSNQGTFLFHLGLDEREFSLFQQMISFQASQRRQALSETPVMKEVVKEIVLVKCGHCGAKYEQGTLKCLTCGGNL